jgi:hypothetical protein
LVFKTGRNNKQTKNNSKHFKKQFENNKQDAYKLQCVVADSYQYQNRKNKAYNFLLLNNKLKSSISSGIALVILFKTKDTNQIIQKSY